MSVDDGVIRRADVGDIRFLPDIERRAASLFDSWLVETGLTPEMLDEVSTVDELEDARRQGHLWIAQSPGGEVVGFALIVILDRTAHLDELDVLPEYGRKGIGGRLVATVRDWARDAGYPAITLSTFRDVPWNRPFYERHGFRVVDPQHLGPEHGALVASEQARGLRIDLRVVMECRLTG
jgi:GNAT superfamily N-acetyltransferase